MNRKQRRTADEARQEASPRARHAHVGGRRCRQEGDCRRTSWRGRRGGDALSTKCWQRFPDHIEALHQKGMLLARTNRVEDGIVLLRRATVGKPREALYWNNLAAACLIMRTGRTRRLTAARKAARARSEIRRWPGAISRWPRPTSGSTGEAAEALETDGRR